MSNANRAGRSPVGSMRPATWTRVLACALALSICVPVALADRGTKSIASCATFGQQDKGDDKVELSINNACGIPVDCSITWRVVCAPESRKRRAVHAGLAKMALPDGATQTAEASAAICGHDGWSIDSIAWTCQPSRD
jgi:hypothetical protein